MPKGFTWVKLHLKDMRALAELPPSAFRVLLELVGLMKPGNVAFARPCQLQKRLNLSSSAISKALSLLIKRQFILPVDKDGYQINHRYFKMGHKRATVSRIPGLIDTSTGRLKLFKRAQ